MSIVNDALIDRIYTLRLAIQKHLREGDDDILRDALLADEKSSAFHQLEPTRKAGAHDNIQQTPYQAALARSGKGWKPTKKGDDF